jgi:hypothetical protein
LGAESRRFKSSRPDQPFLTIAGVMNFEVIGYPIETYELLPFWLSAPWLFNIGFFLTQQARI